MIGQRKPMNKSKTEIKIRGYHLDAYQHVNNARYLELLEEARWCHYEDYPPTYLQEKGWGFIIVNININFKNSACPIASFGPESAVCCWIPSLSKMEFNELLLSIVLILRSPG